MMYEQKQENNIKNKKQIKEKQEQQKNRNKTSELYRHKQNRRKTKPQKQNQLKEIFFFFSNLLKYATQWLY